MRVSKALSYLLAITSIIAISLLTAGVACQGSTEDAPSPQSSESQPTPMAEMVETEMGAPGVSDDRIVFGQSAALSGPAQELGIEMQRGIQAAFHEQNEAGGVHGRMLELTTMDDYYEPDAAYANTWRLINSNRVFALIGEVGTPTSRSASPLANSQGVPFIAPFTGAEFLRDATLDNVLNLRASYHQEIEEMVARLTEDLGITRIAVLYQNDSYGQSGLDGALQALDNRGLAPVASWYYQRNTSAVKTAVLNIVEADPEAVIMVGAYVPVAYAINLVREDIDPIFMAVSFVGSNALAEELGPDGEGVYVTQVVPLPDSSDMPVVDSYHDALKAFDPEAVPGFVSLEGYLAGRLAIAGLEGCGQEVLRECFLDAIRNAGTINIDGMALQFGPGDNQGSDSVFLTVLGADGEYQQVSKLGGSQ